MYDVSNQSDFTTSVSIAEIAAEQEIKSSADFIDLWNNRIKS